MEYARRRLALKQAQPNEGSDTFVAPALVPVVMTTSFRVAQVPAHLSKTVRALYQRHVHRTCRFRLEAKQSGAYGPEGPSRPWRNFDPFDPYFARCTPGREWHLSSYPTLVRPFERPGNRSDCVLGAPMFSGGSVCQNDVSSHFAEPSFPKILVSHHALPGAHQFARASTQSLQSLCPTLCSLTFLTLARRRLAASVLPRALPSRPPTSTPQWRRAHGSWPSPTPCRSARHRGTRDPGRSAA